MRSNVCLSGHPLAFGQFCRCILRTAIVPDEPIRAKGSEWGNFPLTLHLRRCPTSKLIPSVSRTFGAIFAPRLHSPRYSLVPRPPLTAVQLRSSITRRLGHVGDVWHGWFWSRVRLGNQPHSGPHTVHTVCIDRPRMVTVL